MKKIIIGIFAVALTFGGVLATTPAFATKPAPEHKVTLCHATASATNPYVRLTVDVASVFKQGHDQHQARRDIIHPFAYKDKTYPGLNWNAFGISIWENDCNVPTNPEETTSTTFAISTTTIQEQGLATNPTTSFGRVTLGPATVIEREAIVVAPQFTG